MQKKIKTKKHIIRNFIRELKRIKWIPKKQLVKLLIWSLIFIFVCSIFLVGIAALFQYIFSFLRS